jgi:hypothetical protein
MTSARTACSRSRGERVSVSRLPDEDAGPTSAQSQSFANEILTIRYFDAARSAMGRFIQPNETLDTQGHPKGAKYGLSLPAIMGKGHAREKTDRGRKHQRIRVRRLRLGVADIKRICRELGGTGYVTRLRGSRLFRLSAGAHKAQALKPRLTESDRCEFLIPIYLGKCRSGR